MRHLVAVVALAAFALANVIVPAASAEGAGAICVSRIFDFLKLPATRFMLDSQRTSLISEAEYERYRSDLAAAGRPLGYADENAPFTLHETLSAFPFLNRGIIREVILVVCQAGREVDNICRRGDYYAYDGMIDADRLSLMMSDELLKPAPAPIHSCDFGMGDWSALDGP